MRNVTTYPAQLKASVLAKALASNGASIVELAKEFNIPYATIWPIVKLAPTSRQMHNI